MFFLGLIILIPTILSYNFQNKTLVIQKDKKNLENLASVKTYEIQKAISDKMLFLEVVASIPLIKEVLLRKQNSNNELLNYLNTQNRITQDYYDSITLFNDQGKILVSTNTVPFYSPPMPLWSEIVHDEEGRIYLEDLGFNSKTSQYLLAVNIPIKHGGKFLGVLRGTIKVLSLLQTRFDNLNNENIELLLVKSCGTSIFNKESNLFKDKIHHKLLPFLQKEQGIQTVRLNNTDYLVYAKKLFFNKNSTGVVFRRSASLKQKSNVDQNWYLMILSSQDYSLKSITSSGHRFFLLTIVFFFILTIIIAILMGKWVSKPLEQLCMIANEVAQGNLHIRAKVYNNGEVGELCKVFNTMLESLNSSRSLQDELKMALKQKDEVQHNLALAQKVSHIGNWQLNVQTKEAVWSQEILNIFGLSKPPISTGINFLKEYIHTDDWTRVYKDLKEAMLNFKEYKGIFRIVRLDGKERWVECRGKVFKENNVNLIGTLQDITDKIKAQNELIKFKTVIEHSPVSILITDVQGQLEYVNPCFTQITGYELKEVVGKNPRFLKSGFTSDDKYTQLWDTITSQQTWTGTFKNIKKDGSYYWESAIITPIVINNRIENFFAVKQEITKQVYLEEELKEKEKILQQQSKMAIMGEMIENIAHQWRQPLSLISTMASGARIKKELNVLSKEDELQYYDQVIDMVKHLSHTIDDFRNFFKVDKKATHFYVQEVYKRTLSLLSSKFKSNEIQIVENIQDVKLFGFENEFIQVLMNLFTNAKDALEQLDSKRFIFIDVYETNEYQIIKIKDNAGGIPKKILKKVFEPYFTTKSEDEGTGIGLYMAEEIIQKHMQGELLVKNQTFEYENEVYKGAEFTIRFKSKSS